MSAAVDGVIRMHFVQRGGRTVAEDVYHHGNSRASSVINTPAAIPYYFLITTGGGFVAGEHYQEQLDLDAGTHAILTTQMPSSIYKCEHGETTRQENHITLGKDAVLEYYLDEVIPYKHARFRQKTTIEMAKGAKLILTDGLTSGWSPDEKPFQYRDIGIQTLINYDHQLAYNDYLIVNPEDEPMGELGYFEQHENFNSVVVIDENADAQLVQELRDYLATLTTNSRFGISLLEANGLVLRVLGASAHENQQLTQKFVAYYREQVLHLAPLQLRKSQHLEV